MNASDSLFDGIFEQITKSIATRSTRRSFLGRASKVFLGVLGIELLPALPFDPRAYGHPAGPMVDCTQTKYCGAYGRICSGCDNANGDTACPDITATGCETGTGQWNACCDIPNLGGRIVQYYDCFTNLTAPSCNNKCTNGTVCDPLKDAYAPPTGKTTYCCSYIKITTVHCAPT